MQLVWHHVEERLQLDHEAHEERKTGPGGRGPERGVTAAGSGPAESAEATARGCAASAVSSSAAAGRMRHEEALRLLRAGADDYAARAVVAEVPAEVHRCNIIAVQLVPEQPFVVTAAGVAAGCGARATKG